LGITIGFFASVKRELLAHFFAVLAVCKCSLPATTSRLLNVVSNFSGAVLLAKYSVPALQASALITSAERLVVNGVVSSVYSTGVLIGMVKERGDAERKIGTFLQQIFFVSIPLCIISAVSFFFIGDVFLLLGQDEEVVDIVNDYTRPFIVGIPAKVWIVCVQQMMMGVGYVWTSVVFDIINVAVKLPLGYGLVLGKWGLPAWGAYGLAVSHVAGLWASFIFALVFLVLFRPFWKYAIFTQLPRFHQFHAGYKLAVIGVPIGIKVCIERFGMLVTSIFTGWLGAPFLSAQEVVIQYVYFLTVPVTGISSAAGINVSKSLANQNPKQARLFAHSSLITTILLSIGVITLYFAIPKQLISVFLSDKDANLFDLTKYMLWISGAILLFESTRNVTAGALRGYKSTKMPLFLSFVWMWIVCLPVTYVLTFTADLHLWAIFATKGACVTINFVLLFLWFIYLSRFAEKKYSYRNSVHFEFEAVPLAVEVKENEWEMQHVQLTSPAQEEIAQPSPEVLLDFQQELVN